MCISYTVEVYFMSTKRFNLLIDQAEAKRLQQLAAQQDVSVSWLVRRAIRLLLDSLPQPPAKDKDPFLKAIGSFSAESLSSHQIDQLLYESRSSHRVSKRTKP